MRNRIILAILSLSAYLGASGTLTLKEVEDMIDSGRESKALIELQALARQQPANGRIDFDMGLCYDAAGDEANARKSYLEARRKGNKEAVVALAGLEQRLYNLDKASEYIEDARGLLAKSANKSLETEVADLSRRIGRMRSMLDRVEAVVVVDSIVVDKEDFFRAYRLSPESGALNSFSILPDELEFSLPTVVYTTEDGREMMWAAENEDGLFTLRKSICLADGSIEPAENIGDHLGGDGNANYPFLMPDGVTLYYASDRSESIGGLDIFMSRSDGQEYLQPQNIGMPYNSPYDDYMLAIDEMTGIGWWATDRNRLPGKVTIYMFVPEEMRVNVNVNDPGLTSRARLLSISDTWREDTDREAILGALDAVRPSEAAETAGPAISLPDGRIVTDVSDLRSEQAREIYERFSYKSRQLEIARKKLTELRRRYGEGDISVADRIYELEEALPYTEKDIRRLSNDIVRTEMKRQTL